MLNPIKDFILRDHAPTQVFLYSVPIVNVFVRIFQSHHSLDNAADTQAFRIKKENFKNHMRTAIGIQLAVAVSTLALCILLPLDTITGLHLDSIFSLSLGLALSNIFCDSFHRCKMITPKLNGTLNETGW